MRKVGLFGVLVLAGMLVFGQTGPVVINQAQSAGRPGGLVYNKELTFGGILTTNGWGVNSTYARRSSVSVQRLFFTELMFIHHPKELKKVNEYNFSFSYSAPKPFVYGKQNSFFSWKAGYGQQFLIGEKAEKSGFEVSFKYLAGASLGLLKPYYLEILYEEDGTVFKVSQQYGPSTEDLFLDATSIYGYSGFKKGLSEISVVPGGFVRAGMLFDWASYDEYVKSLEAGIGAELYPKDIPIMILENNKPYFFYLYLSLQLGKKW